MTAMSYVTHAEVTLAIAREPHPARRLLVAFLWRTGCRLSEALAVRSGDVDQHLGLVRVVTLKRRAPMSRALPLPAAMLRDLKASGDRPFPWTARVAYGHVRKALERAGIWDGRAHPHALRHGHAIHALREVGAPLDVVSRALGHANVQTTSTYLRATADDIRRFYGDGSAW